MATRVYSVVKDDVQITKQKFLHNFVSEDGTLKYDFMTSLQNIAMAKIVSSLWMNAKIQKDIKDNFKSNKSKFHDFRQIESSRIHLEWRQIEKNVLTAASQLSLPEIVIITKLKNIIKPFGNAVYCWISCHDSMFKSQKQSKYFAVDFIENIKWNCRGDIDYQQTAKNILVRTNNGLSNDHKYKLACAYCLEDEITINAPNDIKQTYLNNVALTKHPMVHFWIAHTTGCDRQWNRNERILRVLAVCPRHKNEVAIKYMWNILSEEEKARNIRLLVNKLSAGFKYSLLSNMNYRQQQRFFKNKYFYFTLVKFLGDWLWEEYFLPTALYVLHVMHPKCYLLILQGIILEIVESLKIHEHIHNRYKSIFKDLWQEAPINLKKFVLNYKNGFALQYLIFSLSWENECDIIELILSDTSVKQKREMILEGKGIKKCTNFVLRDQWDSLNMFIGHTLFCAEDIAELKQRLISYKSHVIVMNFIEQKAWDKMEYFMKWVLKSDEVIDTSSSSEEIYFSSSSDEETDLSSLNEEEIDNSVSDEEIIDSSFSDEEIMDTSSSEENLINVLV